MPAAEHKKRCPAKALHLGAPWSMGCECFVLLRKAADRGWLDSTSLTRHMGGLQGGLTNPGPASNPQLTTEYDLTRIKKVVKLTRRNSVVRTTRVTIKNNPIAWV